MLKKSLKTLVVLLLVLLLTFSCSATLAEEVAEDVNAAVVTNDETTTITAEENVEVPTPENTTTEENQNTTEENQTEESIDEVPEIVSDTTSGNSNPYSLSNISSEDQYIFKKEDVTIDKIIDGNLIIVANNVTINAPVGGDVLVIAKNLTVGENGYITSNLFAMTDTLKVEGTIYDIYAAVTNGFDLADTGTVYRDLHIATNNAVNISGAIGRNAFISGTNNINVAEPTGEALIHGNLNYNATSQMEKEVPQGAVSGSVVYNILPVNTQAVVPAKTPLVIVFGLIISLLFVAFVYAISKWLAPNFVTNVPDVFKHPLRILLYGIGAWLLIPLIAILFIIPIFTIKITIALFGMYFVLAGLSTSVAVIALNSLICKKANINKGIASYLMLLLTGAIVYGLREVPTVGTYIGLVASVLGMGVILSYLTLKSKELRAGKNEEPKPQEKEVAKPEKKPEPKPEPKKEAEPKKKAEPKAKPEPKAKKPKKED